MASSHHMIKNKVQILLFLLIWFPLVILVTPHISREHMKLGREVDTCSRCIGYVYFDSSYLPILLQSLQCHWILCISNASTKYVKGDALLCCILMESFTYSMEVTNTVFCTLAFCDVYFHKGSNTMPQNMSVWA